MVHKTKLSQGSMCDWKCAFCSDSFSDMYSRDVHEVHCARRGGAKQTEQGRRIGTAW